MNVRVPGEVGWGASLVHGLGGDGGDRAASYEEEVEWLHRGEFPTEALSGASQAFLNAPKWGSRPPFRMRR